jgi:phytoene/squalene synthetase
MSRDTSFYYFVSRAPARKAERHCRRLGILPLPWTMQWTRWCRSGAERHAERRGAGARHRAALCSWRRELKDVYEGTPRTPQGLGLQPFVREFTLPRAQFEIAASTVVEMDLAQARYATFDALTEYCRRVASTVGLICLEIFGYRDARSREYAVSLGLALQLTNIIRDVAEDLRSGRVYLPTEDLQRFNVSEADLNAGIVTERIAALLRFECERVRIASTRRRRHSCRARTPTAWWPPRSWARSTSRFCDASSRAATTSSASGCGCRVHSVRRFALRVVAAGADSSRAGAAQPGFACLVGRVPFWQGPPKADPTDACPLRSS